MKLSTVNRCLVALCVLVLLSGLWLHIGYAGYLRSHHGAHELWSVVHIALAALLIIVATLHVVLNKWWFRSLQGPIKRVKVLFQRVFTPSVLLLFLALIVTGAMMLFGWYSKHSHIWTWHYVLGIVWAVFALAHALAFRWHPHHAPAKPAPVPDQTPASAPGKTTAPTPTPDKVAETGNAPQK